MRIAMIGQKGIPSRAGGIEIHVEEISSRLAAKGQDVTVYCRKSYCAERIPIYRGINLKYISSINTKHLDAIIYSFLSTIHALFKGFDIFHYHALGPSTVSWIPRIFGKKVVCTIHGLDWQREKWGRIAKMYLRFGEYASAKFPNKVISVSETLLKYFKTKYNRDVYYIPNGIEMHKRIPAEIITEKFNLHENDYILFLARLVPEKGVHYLIEAFRNISTYKKLVIAGGSSHSDFYERHLHDISKSNPNIIFTGFVEGKTLEELYSNTYLYILPSDIEGMPISLLEAMSYKRVCLVSNIEENLSVIKGYGYSFTKGDIDDLSKKLEMLLNINYDMTEKKNSIHGYIDKEFNWDKIVEKTDEVYNIIQQKRIKTKKAFK